LQTPSGNLRLMHMWQSPHFSKRLSRVPNLQFATPARQTFSNFFVAVEAGNMAG